MKKSSKEYKFSALIHKEEDMFVAECVEIGTFSQGNSIEEALKNVIEATELYIEDMSEEELDQKCNQQIGFMPIHLTPSQAYNAA